MVTGERALSFCRDCQLDHEGRLTERGGKIYLEVACPKGSREELISSDAQLHALLRARAGSCSSRAISGRKPQLGVLEITNRCDLECPVCYAASGPGGGWMIGLDSVQRSARQAAAAGLRWITLTGGEPSLHPDLPEIVSILRKQRLWPLLATNGLRLGKDAALRKGLREAGICKIQVQFDTFAPSTYARMRGRHTPLEKLEIVECLLAENFRVGLVVTVVEENLCELTEIIRFALKRVPALNSVLLQRGVPVGRFLQPPRARIDREAIIHHAVSGLEELRTTDFFPSPNWPAAGLVVHPDCMATTALLRHGHHRRPVGHYLDLERIYRKFPELSGDRKNWRLRVRLLGVLLRSLHWRQVPGLLTALVGLWRGRGRHGVLFVNVGDNMDPSYRHLERLERCSTCLVTPDGLTGVCRAFNSTGTR